MKKDKLSKYINRVLEFEKLDIVLDKDVLDIRDYVYSILENGRWVEDYDIPLYVSSNNEILFMIESNVITNLSRNVYSRPMNIYRNGDMQGGLNLAYIFVEKKLKNKFEELYENV